MVLCALVYVYFLIRKICRTALTATWTLFFSRFYPWNQMTGMSKFLTMPCRNIHNELTDFVFSVKSFIKLKMRYWIFFLCVSVVSHGCKFQRFLFNFFFPSSFLLFLPICLLLILSLWQRNRDMNICSEREVLSHLYFREFCCSLSPITSQINSFCLQWHLLVRAELINCGVGIIETFKCSRCFFSLPTILFPRKWKCFWRIDINLVRTYKLNP